MKTTLDLPDDLLIEAKTLAARRRTTLRAVVETALRRELRPEPDFSNPDPATYEVGPFGILRIKRCPQGKVTPSEIEAIQDQIDAEDVQKALHPKCP